MRFLHLLAPADRRDQIELLIEASEGESNRLRDLRAGLPAGVLAAWLDHEIGQLEARRAWLEDLKGRV